MNLTKFIFLSLVLIPLANYSCIHQNTNQEALQKITTLLNQGQFVNQDLFKTCANLLIERLKAEQNNTKMTHKKIAKKPYTLRRRKRRILCIN